MIETEIVFTTPRKNEEGGRVEGDGGKPDDGNTTMR